MKPIESRIHADAVSAASQVTQADIPPLRLDSAHVRAQRGRTPAWRRDRAGRPARTEATRPSARRPLAALAAAACVVAVIAGVVAGEHAMRVWSPQVQRSRAAAAAASTLAAEAVDMYVPATGGQYTAGLVFSWTERTIEAQVYDSCMARAGFPQPWFAVSEKTYLDSFPDDSKFPDLNQMTSTDSMLGQTYVDPNPSAPFTSAGTSAQRTCVAASTRPLDRIDAIGAALSDQWSDIYTAIQKSPQVGAQRQGFDACMVSHGMPSSYVGSTLNPPFGDFFYWLDQIEQGRGSAVVAWDRHWTPFFVACAGPAVALMDQLQLARRTSFLTAQATQVSEIKALVADLASQYPVTVGQ
jgi:hypothetical protein